MIEFVVTREAVFEPQTEVFYAYSMAEAEALAAEKQAETGSGWRIYARVGG